MNRILFFSFLFIIFGCTELNEPTMHPADWTSPSSENSHMAKIAVTGIEACRDCHGGMEKNDFFGGTSGVSCYECHAGGPSGHPDFDVWVGSPNHSEFHGNDDVNRCKTCHGDDLSGGIANVSCLACHNAY
jgi:hypothetical protein